ncbi:MAG: hypothetical protein ACI4PO_02555 [Faecousia sp.]
MGDSGSIAQFLFFVMLYSFLGWAIEVTVISIRDRQFVNTGFLNIPFALPYGFTAAILMSMLDTLNGNLLLQYVFCFVVCWAVNAFSDHVVARLRRDSRGTNRELSRKEKILHWALTFGSAGVYLIIYLLIHPWIGGLVMLMPKLLLHIFAIVFAVLVAADFVCVILSLRKKSVPGAAEQSRQITNNLAERISVAVQKRLEKYYPGILEDQGLAEKKYVFAQGLCLDKLIWVFLLSSFLGALIEMVFCRITGGFWMSRSSVLYGPFSFVWGFGAVLLTIVLQRFANKSVLYIFLAGFIVGGAYEYLCSVFTEIVFGTVFWDYSYMPLNIGGRTNVLYCVFWGLLAVVWIKGIYPPMSTLIEKVPPVTGKIITWVLVFVLLCDGILTCGAMARYTDRQNSPTPDNAVESFFDSRYDDAWMENRWPNMIVTE